MNPDYEGKDRPLPPGTGTAEQQAFDYFKQLRNVGLLQTDGAKDLYFVAMESGEVFLSPAGRYFWRLAAKKQL